MLRGEVCDAEPAAFKLVEEFETLLSGDSLAGDRSLNLFHAAHLTPSTRPSARWGTDDAYATPESKATRELAILNVEHGVNRSAQLVGLKRMKLSA